MKLMAASQDKISWRAVEILATREADLLLQATQDSKGTIAL